MAGYGLPARRYPAGFFPGLDSKRDKFPDPRRDRIGVGVFAIERKNYITGIYTMPGNFVASR